MGGKNKCPINGIDDVQLVLGNLPQCQCHSQNVAAVTAPCPLSPVAVVAPPLSVVAADLHLIRFQAEIFGNCRLMP